MEIIFAKTLGGKNPEKWLLAKLEKKINSEDVCGFNQIYFYESGPQASIESMENGEKLKNVIKALKNMVN